MSSLQLPTAVLLSNFRLLIQYSQPSLY